MHAVELFISSLLERSLMLQQRWKGAGEYWRILLVGFHRLARVTEFLGGKVSELLSRLLLVHDYDVYNQL